PSRLTALHFPAASRFQETCTRSRACRSPHPKSRLRRRPTSKSHLGREIRREVAPGLARSEVASPVEIRNRSRA
ncbi:hypothetical protein DFH09DRAFT_1039368, partial [Mycena vulgaris]